MKVAILANGEAPKREEAVRELLGADVLVCCDGAVGAARALGREPDWAVGDVDSIGEELRKELGERFVRVAEQETNDLSKAFRWAVERYGRGIEVVVLGAGGGREDHLIGNVYRLAEFAGEAKEVTMVTEAGRFWGVAGVWRGECEEGRGVSVFAPQAGTRAKSRGLKWGLEGVDLGMPWAGTLNRAEGGEIEIAADKNIIVYMEG